MAQSHEKLVEEWLRRNRYFTCNFGNKKGGYSVFSTWKLRERANEKEGLKLEKL